MPSVLQDASSLGSGRRAGCVSSGREGGPAEFLAGYALSGAQRGLENTPLLRNCTGQAFATDQRRRLALPQISDSVLTAHARRAEP
jgi:hypothetical protein